MPVLDWTNPDDLLAYAIELPSRKHRAVLVANLRRREGAAVANRLIADLKQYAENMGTTK